jgi:hypothetical protein
LVPAHSGVHDLVAARGEALFRVLISRSQQESGFLFQVPHFLGEKQRTVDFYVELVSAESAPPHFFVQVKTTRAGYTHRERRLRVRVSDGELQRLAGYHAPTYIVGIDEPWERGYIVSANGERTRGWATMTTAYPLEGDVLTRLRNEVEAYWALPERAAFCSEFIDPRGREP